MSDIWSNVGSNIQPREGDWLYRTGSEIHGPVPKQVIVEKLLRGDLGLRTPVAREGGEFHPIGQVAAFAEHIDQAARVLKKRVARKTRLVLLAVGLLVMLGGGAGGLYLKLEADAHKAAQEKAAKALAQEKAAQQAAMDKFLNEHKHVKLVALVSFDQSKLKVGGSSKKAGSATKPGGTKAKPSSAPKKEEFVSQCQRSQQQIFGVLAKHLRTINICVQDEKTRDQQGLLPKTLVLDFVATPTGKVVDFGIDNRHYRTGPMKNCMVKAFRLIRFPAVGGSNCPVSIPIKIGS